MMSHRCKHINAKLIEIATAEHIRFIKNGVMDEEGINEMGNITGYEIHCFDCKKFFKFKSAYNPPKWAEKYFDAL